MNLFTNPAFLTPDQRTRELARLLAAGLLRLARPFTSAELGPETRQKSLSNELALRSEKSVTVHAG